jgi:hypothetical protein
VFVGCTRRTAIVLVLALTSEGHATDVVASLKDAKAECVYLHTLCAAARSAKREAEQAMSHSRAYHLEARGAFSEQGDTETRRDVRREGHDVQERLTAASRRRADATASFTEAAKLVTAKHRAQPVCAVCRGIAD